MCVGVSIIMVCVYVCVRVCAVCVCVCANYNTSTMYLPTSTHSPIPTPADQDQTRQKDIVDSFEPDPNSSSFHRPQSEMNIASGCPLFAPVSILADQRYVAEDTMFLKVVVDTTDLPILL